MELLGILAIAVVGFWLYKRERLDGRVVLPLQTHSALVASIARHALRHPIVSGFDSMTEAQVGRQAIYPSQFAGFVREQLRETEFPRARLHDLKREVSKIVEAFGVVGYPSQGYYVRKAFEDIAEEYDTQTKAWTV